MKPAFEIFDHTADAGIRAWAPSQPELLVPAGEGLYSLIGQLLTGNDSSPLALNLTGGAPELLLRDYLNELLILFERHRRRVISLESACLDDKHLAVDAWTAPVDAERSVFSHEVKAITYHELAIRPIPGGFEATIIVDI